MTTDVQAIATTVAADRELLRTKRGGRSADYAHNLADLQADARKRYRMSPEQTLAAALALHGHCLITNPCVVERRLPESQRRELSRLAKSYGFTTRLLPSGLYRTGPGWFDKQIGDESGITLTLAPFAAKFGLKLSRDELRVYRLVHERLMELFTSPSSSLR